MTSKNISSNKLLLRVSYLTIFFRTLSMIKLLLSNSVLLKDNYYMLILCLSDFLTCFFLTTENDNLSEPSELLVKFLLLFLTFFILLTACSSVFSLFSSLVSTLFSVFLISLFLKFNFTSIFSLFFTLLIEKLILN